MSDPIKTFKLQRPLGGTGAEPINGMLSILVYTRGHEQMAQVPMTVAETRHLFGTRPKVYALARFVPNRAIEGTRKFEVIRVLPSSREPEW